MEKLTPADVIGIAIAEAIADERFSPSVAGSEYIQELRDSLVQLPQWRPIETAPMNIEVLISDGDYVYAAICRYQGGAPDEDWEVPMVSCGYRQIIRKPTHWMPKPEPPI
jgi:hypothetical protein